MTSGVSPATSLHDWNLDPAAARQLQATLAPAVRLQPLPVRPSLIAGVDCGLERQRWIRAAVTLMRFPELMPVQTVVARTPCRFPYVPGLLSFREMPGLLAALEQLEEAPALILCDGQGIAHPRRLGIASHLGLWLGIPAIGVGKSRLIGSHPEPGRERGATAPLVDADMRVGTVLRTRTDVRPVFVSPGHLVDHDSAVEWVMRTLTRYRLPEPIRLADRASRSGGAKS